MKFTAEELELLRNCFLAAKSNLESSIYDAYGVEPENDEHHRHLCQSAKQCEDDINKIVALEQKIIMAHTHIEIVS